MRILILGSSGFIGSHLVKTAIKKGHEVICMSRKESRINDAVVSFQWGLGQPLDDVVGLGVDCAIHLSYDFSGEEGASLTLKETLKNIDALIAMGVKKQLIYSSYSAGPHSKSLYGKTKYSLELGSLSKTGTIIVRPGLVIGDGGIYGRITSWVNKFHIVPLPDGGAYPIPIVNIEDLCENTINLCVADQVPRECNFFQDKKISLKVLVKKIAHDRNTKVLCFSIPSWLIAYPLKTLDLLRIKVPINVDNIIGYKANSKSPHTPTKID